MKPTLLLLAQKLLMAFAPKHMVCVFQSPCISHCFYLGRAFCMCKLVLWKVGLEYMRNITAQPPDCAVSSATRLSPIRLFGARICAVAPQQEEIECLAVCDLQGVLITHQLTVGSQVFELLSS